MLAQLQIFSARNKIIIGERNVIIKDTARKCRKGGTRRTTEQFKC